MNGINYIHFVVEGMEGSFGQQRGSSEELRKMAEELFRLNCGSDIELTELVPILERYGMVEYLSFEQFSQYIAQTTHNALFQSAFKEDFNKYVSTHPSAQYHFPVIKDQRMTAFGRVTAIKFAQEYLLERTKVQTAKPKYAMQKCYEIYPQQRFKDEINNHKLTPSETTVVPSETTVVPSETTVVPSQTTAVGGKSAQLQQGSIAKQAHATQKTETEASKIVPDFFYRRKEFYHRYSTKCLLSIDVTSLFEEELAQVKAIIEGQIEGNFFVFQSFQEFFKEYCFFDEISKSEEFNEEDHLRLIDYYQKVYWGPRNKTVCLFEDKESELMQIWNKMQKRAKQTAETKWEAVQPKVKSILKQSLKNIYLSLIHRDYRQQVHVLTTLDIVVINLITDIPSLEFYREKFLKPSFFVCIYHQMAHKIIRNIQSFDFIGLENPFSLEKQTFGNKLLKIILNNMSEIKEIFNKLQITENNDETNKMDKIYRNVKKQFKLLLPNIYIITNLQNIGKFNQVIEKNQTVRFFKHFFKQRLGIQRFQKIEKQVYEFMKVQRLSKGKQRSYSTIQQLFPFAMVAYQIFNRNGVDSYLQFTEKVLKLSQFRQNGFFSQYRKILISLTSKDQTFFSRPQVKIFVQWFLSFQSPYQKLYKDLVKLELDCCLKDKVLEMQDSEDEIQYNQRYFPQAKIYDIIEFEKSLTKPIKFIKYSDIYLIATKMNFLFNTRLESGFQIEYKLFPCLQQSGKIYQKDFQLMKNIGKLNCKYIAKQPKGYEGSSYMMLRGQRKKPEYVNVRFCGFSRKRNMKW